MTHRTERDLIGEEPVPVDVYYGIQTQRAMHNFQITGIPIGRFGDLIKALAVVKQACVRANGKLSLLCRKKCKAIDTACQEIIDGELHEHFVVDSIQGGAGTSTNMNANEVIANRALELLGHCKGEYQYLHPNNDVNRSQSTNDVYATAARLAVIFGTSAVTNAIADLGDSFKKKGTEFANTLKMGRTQLQDAVPMTLGQEFDGFAENLNEDIHRLTDVAGLLLEVNLGGTAIGTGINTHPKYGVIVIAALSESSGLPVQSTANMVEATSDMGAFVLYSAVIKRLAIKLSKICNDLRLLSSGPRTGIGEIRLPAMQPGSSIMPGKVNPVIPEAVNQTAFQVIGNDLAITMAAEAGQLQLNAMEPLIVYNLLQSMQIITKAMIMLRDRCIRGITANEQHCSDLVHNSIGIITALVPYIGYDAANRIAKLALESERSVIDLILAEGLLDKARVMELLHPNRMLSPASM